MSDKSSIDRRAYLTAVGSGSVAALAGCLGEPDAENDTAGGGDGDGNDSMGNDSGSGDGEEQAIVAGTAPGFPPFEIKQDGELTGFDVELLEAVVEAAPGYTFDRWSEFEFDSLIPALTGGDIDVIAAAMTITEERRQTIAFTDAYYEADQSILVRADGDFQPTELGDLAGRPIGAQTGTTGEGVIRSELIETGDLSESNYNGYGNYTLAVQDLENGNIDAIVIDKPVAETFASERDVEVAFTYETGEEYGFGIRQDAGDIQSALNEGLATVEEDGTYEELRNEWFSSESTTTESGGNESAGTESTSTES
ncbi:transporter substrate-binding domain-containing protein [Halomarina oriensis]|uniref:Transporter substrate-binding domain-containing protein n=1 Tax=Halomarina oriensis TaxID=671145 RepID=A0A6B0GHX5_9EURY|nr:transporter substrate-binding domain-containing protein [Halomarina oriensis]MWG34210.1 transporter substrate-binding domain-containing protein [Halomarina oriensis]